MMIGVVPSNFVKTLRIRIASYENMKARTMAIARGELKPKAHEPKVWFTSTESFARVLSNKNRALPATIAATHPSSLQELADRTGRKASNLSPTLKTMEHYGFARLHRGARTCPPRSALSIDLAGTTVQRLGLIQNGR
jgi:predicted transcriptional regulator